jgi:amino acid transporter
MKFGCSFFGWLTATGTAVLLSALLAAVATALNLRGVFGAQPTANSQDIRTMGLVSGIVLLVVVLISYFAGGYGAARMARFSGAKQGLGVWLWALIFTIVVVVIGLVAGNSLDLLSRANGLPQLPVSQGTLTGGGIITLVAIILISLVGAVLGGLAGMRYHRRVDRAGFEAL